MSGRTIIEKVGQNEVNHIFSENPNKI